MGIAEDFMAHYWANSRTTIWPNRFLGYPALVHPFDGWIIQEIICETKPERIVESGVFIGGSTLLWSSLLEWVQPDARIVGVDVWDRVEVKDHPLWKRVDYIEGSSTDPEVVAEVAALVDGYRTMVILDSDHAADHVEREMALYSGLVSPNCYLVVCDGAIEEAEPEHGPGPLTAIRRFLGSDTRFTIDNERERMLITGNPSGYLRRRPDEEQGE